MENEKEINDFLDNRSWEKGKKSKKKSLNEKERRKLIGKEIDNIVSQIIKLMKDPNIDDWDKKSIGRYISVELIVWSTNGIVEGLGQNRLIERDLLELEKEINEEEDEEENEEK